MAEFKVGDFDYRSSKMDAFTQFHVVRRLTPLMAKFKELSAGEVASLQSDEVTDEEKAKIAGPILEGINEMEDKDLDYITHRCMETVQRRVEGDRGWAPIWSPGVKRLMFEDINMISMLLIAANVLAGELGNFSDGRP